MCFLFGMAGVALPLLTVRWAGFSGGHCQRLRLSAAHHGKEIEATGKLKLNSPCCGFLAARRLPAWGRDEEGIDAVRGVGA